MHVWYSCAETSVDAVICTVEIVVSLAAQHASMQETDEPRCRGEGYEYLADDRPSGPLVWRQIEKRSVLSEKTVDRI